MKDGCWKLHPDQAPKWFYQEKEKINVITSMEPKLSIDIDDSSVVDEKMACVGFC